jgi:hypothetical protein
MKIYGLVICVFLWIGSGCESIHHSNSSIYWQQSSSFPIYSRSGLHAHRFYPQSIKIPNKSISKMNGEEMRRTAQAINWANQINRGYWSNDWPHERRLDIWMEKP